MKTVFLIVFIAICFTGCLAVPDNLSENSIFKPRSLSAAEIIENIDPTHLEYPYAGPMVQEVYEKTGVALITNIEKIHKEEIILNQTVARADLLPVGQFQWTVKIVKTALREYPKSILSKYINEIVLCNNLGARRPGGIVIIGGTFNFKKRRLLINAEIDPDIFSGNEELKEGITQATEIFHHEINHMLFFLERFPKGKWSATNPSGFSYTEMSSADYLDDYNQFELEMGFINDYSRKNMAEDVAVMAGKYFSDREKFYHQVKDFPLVMKKFNILKSFYSSLDPSFRGNYGEGEGEANPDLFLGYSDYFIEDNETFEWWQLSELIADAMEWYGERHEADFAIKMVPTLSVDFEDRIEGYIFPGGVDDFAVFSALTGRYREFLYYGENWENGCPPDTLHIVTMYGRDIQDFVGILTRVRGLRPVVFSKGFETALLFREGKDNGEIKKMEIRGVKIDPDLQYRIAVTSYLAKGGIDLDIRAPSELFLAWYPKGFQNTFGKAQEDFDSGVSICDVLMEYIKQQNVLEYQEENRLHWIQ